MKRKSFKKKKQFRSVKSTTFCYIYGVSLNKTLVLKILRKQKRLPLKKESLRHNLTRFFYFNERQFLFLKYLTLNNETMSLCRHQNAFSGLQTMFQSLFKGPLFFK